MDEIYRTSEGEDGSGARIPVYDLSSRYLNSTDKMIEVFYDLFDAEYDRLSPIDGPQELVFSLAGTEVTAVRGEEGQVTFNNLEHLELLNEDDIIALRLYSNQDAGNILWEYAFGNAILVGVEVTQGIQDYWSFEELGLEYYNPVDQEPVGPQRITLDAPLVSGKPTTMRVYFKESNQDRVYDLQVNDGEKVQEVEHFVPANCTWEEQRRNGPDEECRSYDQEVKGISEAKNLPVNISVKEQGDSSIPEAWDLEVDLRSMVNTKTLTLRFFKHCLPEEVNDEGEVTQEQQCTENYRELAEAYVDYLRSQLPFSENQIEVKFMDDNPVISDPKNEGGFNEQSYLWEDSNSIGLWIIEAFDKTESIVDDEKLRVSSLEKAILLVDPSLVPNRTTSSQVNGVARHLGSGYSIIWSRSDVLHAAETLLHELGHTWGRPHTGVNELDNCRDSYVADRNRDWPYPDNRLHQHGDGYMYAHRNGGEEPPDSISSSFRKPDDRIGLVFNHNPNGVNLERNREIMAYCDAGSRYMSTWTYRKIMGHMQYFFH